MYIHHLTLNTGHLVRTSRADVRDDVLAGLATWLEQAITCGQRLPLPVPAMAEFSALALVQHGCLVVTVYAPAGPHLPGRAHGGNGVPLVTLGVAQRSRHAAALWPMLLQAFGTFARPGLPQPAPPWLAAVVLPSLGQWPDAAEWLGDLERCLAWAWITRRPALGLATP